MKISISKKKGDRKMKRNEPYYYATKHYLHTYHGGGCSMEHLRKSHRGQIKTFSRSSMIRLCLKLDSIIGFKPKWRITATYNGLPDWNIVRKTINNYTTRLSIPRYSNKIPIWFWKKNIINNNLTIIIITNLQPTLASDTFILASEYFLQHYSSIPLKKITTEKIEVNEDAITDFCFNNTIDCNYPSGKWWGIKNQRFYKKEVIKKVTCTILELESLEFQNKEKILITTEIKKNLYKK